MNTNIVNFWRLFLIFYLMFALLPITFVCLFHFFDKNELNSCQRSLHVPRKNVNK